MTIVSNTSSGVICEIVRHFVDFDLEIARKLKSWGKAEEIKEVIMFFIVKDKLDLYALCKKGIKLARCVITRYALPSTMLLRFGHRHRSS